MVPFHPAWERLRLSTFVKDAVLVSGLQGSLDPNSGFLSWKLVVPHLFRRLKALNLERYLAMSTVTTCLVGQFLFEFVRVCVGWWFGLLFFVCFAASQRQYALDVRSVCSSQESFASESTC